MHASDLEEAQFVRQSLKKFGVAEDIGPAIAALGGMIRDHAHLQSLLSGESGETRGEIYEAVRPHLKFTPWPLDRYIAEAGRKAEAEQLPVFGADGKLYEFSPAQDILSVEKQAEQVLAAAIAKRTLTLTCSRCTRQQSFVGVGEETPVAVIMKARREGWVHIPFDSSETCPKCANRELDS